MFLISKFRRVVNIAFFLGVITGRLNFMCCLFGTSAHKIQTPGNHPKEMIQKIE
jgi:hypothetical protein